MPLDSRLAFAEFDTDGTAAEHTAHLLACVRAAFPALPVSSSRVETVGGDHVLLIIDDTYAFRFPRAGMHDLRLEIEVLRLLQRRSAVSMPFYDYIDPAGRFAGYRFIEGAQLTRSRFAALSPAAGDQVLADGALFLSALHSLPIDAVRCPGRWPMAWTAAEYAERGLTQRLPLIAAHAPHLAEPIEAFYRSHQHDRPDHLVVIHGDLVPDHLLLCKSAERLAGVIDFGDVALGDPAQDFLAFWSYGEEAVGRVVQLYRPGDADPGLFGRSRNHFIRHQIDRLFERLNDGAIQAAHADQGAIASLGDLLGEVRRA